MANMWVYLCCLVAGLARHLDAVNPEFSNTEYSFKVADQAVAATSVGTVSVSDTDAGDTFTFGFCYGNINDDFAITNTGNSKEGLIAVAAGKTLDMASTSSYEILVTVSDGTFVAHSTITIGFSTLSGAASLHPICLLMVFTLLLFL